MIIFIIHDSDVESYRELIKNNVESINTDSIREYTLPAQDLPYEHQTEIAIARVIKDYDCDYREQTICFHTTNSTCFDVYRSLIKFGMIWYEDTVCLYVDRQGEIHNLKFDKHGRIADWPHDLGLTRDNALSSLL